MNEVGTAAEEFADAREPRYVADPLFGVGQVHHSGWCKLEEGFLAGAAWQVERVLEELNMVRSYFTEEDARPGADNILGQAICAVERICDKKHKTQSCDTSRSITPSGTPENK